MYHTRQLPEAHAILSDLKNGDLMRILFGFETADTGSNLEGIVDLFRAGWLRCVCRGSS